MASFLKKIAGGGSAHSQQQSEQNHEQSLTTILSTHEDRSELLLLVANCMGQMRRQAADIFDPDQGHESWNRPLSPGSGDDKIVRSGEHPAVTAKDTPSTEPSPEQLEEQRKKGYERRAAELSSVKMTELKDATLSHFDTWRDQVIQRLGEIINQHQDDKPGTSKTDLKTPDNAKMINSATSLRMQRQTLHCSSSTHLRKQH